jgi:hypothetical protein
MLVANTPRSQLPGIFSTGESRLPSVFITAELFWKPGSVFTDFKKHIFKGHVILKIDCGYFQLLGDI